MFLIKNHPWPTSDATHIDKDPCSSGMITLSLPTDNRIHQEQDISVIETTSNRCTCDSTDWGGFYCSSDVSLGWHDLPPGEHFDHFHYDHEKGAFPVQKIKYYLFIKPEKQNPAQAENPDDCVTRLTAAWPEIAGLNFNKILSNPTQGLIYPRYLDGNTVCVGLGSCALRFRCFQLKKSLLQCSSAGTSVECFIQLCQSTGVESGPVKNAPMAWSRSPPSSSSKNTLMTLLHSFRFLFNFGYWLC